MWLWANCISMQLISWWRNIGQAQKPSFPSTTQMGTTYRSCHRLPSKWLKHRPVWSLVPAARYASTWWPCSHFPWYLNDRKLTKPFFEQTLCSLWCNSRPGKLLNRVLNKSLTLEIHTFSVVGLEARLPLARFGYEEIHSLFIAD